MTRPSPTIDIDTIPDKPENPPECCGKRMRQLTERLDSKAVVTGYRCGECGAIHDLISNARVSAMPIVDVDKEEARVNWGYKPTEKHPMVPCLKCGFDTKVRHLFEERGEETLLIYFCQRNFVYPVNVPKGHPVPKGCGYSFQMTVNEAKKAVIKYKEWLSDNDAETT